jgi:orotate phosphoribosyltransferase
MQMQQHKAIFGVAYGRVPLADALALLVLEGHTARCCHSQESNASGFTTGTRLVSKLIFAKIYMCSDLVVRGRIELPTFRFSAPGIPAVTPVLGGKSVVVASR